MFCSSTTVALIVAALAEALHPTVLLFAQEKLRATAADSGLVAWYPFDGDARDASGNDNHGTLRGFRPTSDRNGAPASALLFVGSNDAVVLNPSSDFAFSETRALSLGGWFAVPTRGESPAVCFMVGGGGPICRYFAFVLNVQDQFASARVHASECNINVQGSILSGHDTWHHVFVTVDDGFLSLYIDGIAVDRRAVYDMKWDTPMMKGLQISGDPERGSPKGSAIDDFRIYRRALSAEEVTKLIGRKNK